MPMARVLSVIGAVALLATACSAGEDTTTTAAEASATTTAPVAETTTTAAPATTTTSPAAGETTTTVEGETTTTLAAAVVPATNTIGVLQPYSTGGGDLFPAGSVEAHWYQWDGSYIVLYRGFDAASGQEICAGNSILIEGVGFESVTNSPHLDTADAICVDADKVLEAPGGVRACGSLLYYLTEIPIDGEGTLFGTLEIGFGDDVWEGQTSQALTNPSVPEFEPDLPAYELPPSDLDELGAITCGV
jgi:hypothetical protein